MDQQEAIKESKKTLKTNCCEDFILLNQYFAYHNKNMNMLTWFESIDTDTLAWLVR